MSSTTGKFVSELSLNIKTINPITLVHTDDPFESLELIHAAIPAIRGDTDKVYYWSETTKWIDISERDKDISDLVSNPTKAEFPKEQLVTTLSPIFASPEILKGRKPVFIVSFLTAKFKKEVTALMQELRDFDYFARSGINSTYRLIVLANKSFEMNSDYENLFGFIDHSAPSEPELQEIFRDKFLDYVDGTVSKIFTGNFATARAEIEALETFALNTLRGLSARQALITLNKALSKCALRSGKKVVGFDYAVFKDYCTEVKFKEINGTETLTLLKPFPMAQVGGLSAVKSWIDERAFAYTLEAKARRVRKPKGALLVGPPGTAKTLLARAIGDRLQRPTVKFDVADVFGRYVGDSEKAMKKTIETIEAIGPSVLFIDEIDKVFGDGDGGEMNGGTTTRVLGKLLTWAQERESDVFLIMTANRIANIPAELLRKGRLDENFFVTFPNREEREEIVRIHLAKAEYDLEELLDVIEATNGYSGAELEYIVNEAILKAAYRDEELSQDHLIEIAAKTIPMSISFADDLESMTAWAMSNAVHASGPVTPSVVYTPTRELSMAEEAEPDF